MTTDDVDHITELENRLDETLEQLSKDSRPSMLRTVLTNVTGVALIAIAAWAVKTSSDVSLLQERSSSAATGRQIYELETRLRRDFESMFPQPWLREAIERLEKKVDTQSDKIGALDLRLTRLESRIDK
ncbi:MAG: hypothetical protein AAB134_02300 [Pseudomonadota bacterium]